MMITMWRILCIPVRVVYRATERARTWPAGLETLGQPGLLTTANATNPASASTATTLATLIPATPRCGHATPRCGHDKRATQRLAGVTTQGAHGPAWTAMSIASTRRDTLDVAPTCQPGGVCAASGPLALPTPRLPSNRGERDGLLKSEREYLAGFGRPSAMRP